MEFDDLDGKTPEELEAMLANTDFDSAEDGEGEVKGGNDSTTGTDKDAAKKETDTDQSRPARQSAKTGDTETPPPGDADASDEPQKVIIGKDGKHQIPYDVLQAAREDAKRNAQVAQARETELNDLKRNLELLQKQINAAGLQPAQLPENAKITPEQIATVSENFPELAGVLETMVAKIDFIQQTGKPAEAEADASGDPVRDAINRNTELKSWFDNDIDRRDMAITIDERLKNDPAWKDKSLDERFTEVARRTKAAFGDKAESEPAGQKLPTAEELKKLADEKLAQAKATAGAPASPSDLGQANSQSPQSTLDKLVNGSDSDIYAAMSGMSDDAIDALLSQAGF
ncbi:hypothetical protein PMPD1_2471 [Paramixta manurensis]|uniref:Uncharacterized protein n=1 Tax=Paramixta manurensis TaxID=2740817 RepID=A0A6M8UQG5_9GAMM|nr:hypothetical protein PMPD1_2471 [Erwiniaceae bacterium PD-1]